MSLGAANGRRQRTPCPSPQGRGKPGVRRSNPRALPGRRFPGLLEHSTPAEAPSMPPLAPSGPCQSGLIQPSFVAMKHRLDTGQSRSGVSPLSLRSKAARCRFYSRPSPRIGNSRTTPPSANATTRQTPCSRPPTAPSRSSSTPAARRSYAVWRRLSQARRAVR